MKQKFLILGTLVTLILGALGMVLVLQRVPTQVRAAGDGRMTPLVLTAIFQDNFDSYTAPGPLPTGTGATQWTAVKVKGAGAVSVSNTVAKSLPNSLRITLGASTTTGFAYAQKKYSTSYATHAARVAVYLDSSLTLTKSISLFATQNSTNTLNGSFSVLLAANHSLQVVWYTSTGKKLVHTTSSRLTPGQWYTVELDQTNSATAGAWTLYLNGTQIASRVPADTGSLPVDTFIAGDTLKYTSATAGSFYLDDVVTAAKHIG